PLLDDRRLGRTRASAHEHGRLTEAVFGAGRTLGSGEQVGLAAAYQRGARVAAHAELLDVLARWRARDVGLIRDADGSLGPLARANQARENEEQRADSHGRAYSEPMMIASEISRSSDRERDQFSGGGVPLSHAARRLPGTSA